MTELSDRFRMLSRPPTRAGLTLPPYIAGVVAPRSHSQDPGTSRNARRRDSRPPGQSKNPSRRSWASKPARGGGSLTRVLVGSEKQEEGGQDRRGQRGCTTLSWQEKALDGRLGCTSFNWPHCLLFGVHAVLHLVCDFRQKPAMHSTNATTPGETSTPKGWLFPLTTCAKSSVRPADIPSRDWTLVAQALPYERQGETGGLSRVCRISYQLTTRARFWRPRGRRWMVAFAFASMLVI
ncbi:hypothetical protein BKA70DRAFT_814289 [Coprinopsis sp. MPI-PUGE-AT-0042]|nr:hypothetical protein BKA70DRAFT_814289 [Coprinopsis sp. MPI-PUGE-AT-0042]